MPSPGKRLTKRELESILRQMLPACDSAKILKSELADQRANFASWLYKHSEPIDDTAPRHTLD